MLRKYSVNSTKITNIITNLKGKGKRSILFNPIVKLIFVRIVLYDFFLLLLLLLDLENKWRRNKLTSGKRVEQAYFKVTV